MKELKDMTLEELWELFPIVLKQHNPAYDLWYCVEQDKLKTILSSFDLTRISHIGSTAVRGLLAKPTIDILLELKSDYCSDAVLYVLQNDGWTLMSRSESEKTMDFNKGYTQHGFDEKVYHLHVKPSGDWGELYFRDYLRAYPDVARQYESLKRKLKDQYEHNRDAYTNGKSEFVLKYTKIAREEFQNCYMPIEE